MNFNNATFEFKTRILGLALVFFTERDRDMNFQASESFHSESNLVRLKNSSLNKSDPSLNTSFVSLFSKQRLYIYVNSSNLYSSKITIF